MRRMKRMKRIVRMLRLPKRSSNSPQSLVNLQSNQAFLFHNATKAVSDRLIMSERCFKLLRHAVPRTHLI
jgi:hypothetical protein